MSRLKLLTGEPLPRLPQQAQDKSVGGEELVRYIRNLHNFLRRMFANITDEEVEIIIDESIPNGDEQNQVLYWDTTLESWTLFDPPSSASDFVLSSDSG